ncbi:MAG TPA: TonB-dependent receptor [Vicinamibacterales bacterium]|nr:TonB-dependent receptor [Vicinamibacterales bacterium]
MRRNWLVGGALAFVFIFLAGPGVGTASAQAMTGTISGRVTLENGDPVHGATVIVVGARRQATTGDDGKFEISNVPAGTYSVLAQRVQLSTSRQTATVAAGQIATLEFKLSIGIHEEIVVTGTATGVATTFGAFNSVTSLDATALAKKLGATIADALQDEPGMAKRTFGPGTSRPIIRGFDGDRVLVMQDGVRTGDLSSQSGDHGVSIDPAGLARLEVVKGPATLLYGSNALGGVVNAITPQDAFRSSPFTGTLGGVSFDAGSANEQTGFAGNVQHGRGALLVHGSFTGRRTGDYDAPDETIPNSATRLFTGEGGVGWTGGRGYFGVSAGVERNRYGIPFAGLLFEGEEEAQVDLEVKRQNVRFDTGIRNLGGAFADAFRVTASYLDYQHDELEIEDGAESLGTRFKNQIFTVRAELEQRAGGRWNGRLGVEFLTRDYQAIGAEALAPATTQNAFSAFVYEEVSVGRHRVQFGGRAERNAYEASFEDGVVERNFTGASGSVGLHADIHGKGAFVVNVTGASRAPALEELFNFGPHPGNLAFEIGNPDLELERTVGLDVSLRGRGSRVHGEVNFFVYNISNFVFLDITDEIEDGFRVANYVQGDSRFTGVEGAGHFHLGPRAELNASLGYVQAKLTAGDEPLPRIPPFHGRVDLEARAGAFTIIPEVVFSGKQTKVFRDETTTDSWATFNLGATWQRSAAHASHLIAAQAYNLANKTYRLHTSFLKDLVPEIGRGIKVTYSLRFF